MLSACTADGVRVVDGSEVVVATSESFSSYNDKTAFGNSAANNQIVYATNSSFSYFTSDRELVRDESFGEYEIVSDDPFSVRYTLASGITWSDGTPIDAADLLLAWAANSGAFTTAEFDPSAYIDQATGEFSAEFPDDVVYFDGATRSGLQRVTTLPVVSSDRRSITLNYGKYFADWEIAFQLGVPAHVVGERALDLPAGDDNAQRAKDAVVAAIAERDESALAALSRSWNSDFNFDTTPTDDRLLVGSGPYTVTAIEPKWLIEVAPQFFKVADANKISKRKRQEKIEPLFNKVSRRSFREVVLVLNNAIVRETGRMATIKSQTECTFGMPLYVLACFMYLT